MIPKAVNTALPVEVEDSEPLILSGLHTSIKSLTQPGEGLNLLSPWNTSVDSVGSIISLRIWAGRGPVIQLIEKIIEKATFQEIYKF